MKRKSMTKPQHIVALLIMLPSLPFALPLGLLVLLSDWLNRAAEWLYETTSVPFLWANRKWEVRCDKLNNPDDYTH